MTIDKLGPIDSISKYNKTEKVSRAEQFKPTDSISFSEEAKLAPEVRLDRIEEVKKKLEDPSYINDKVVETVAERVMELFKI